jgi:hypothetical protein
VVRICVGVVLLLIEHCNMDLNEIKNKYVVIVQIVFPKMFSVG